MSYSNDRNTYRALLGQWGQGLKNLDVDAVRSMATTSMSVQNAKLAPNVGIDNIVTLLRNNNYPRLVVCKLLPVSLARTGRKPSVVYALVNGKNRKVAVFDGKGLEVGTAYNFTLGWKSTCTPVFEVKTSKKTGRKYIQGLRSDGKGSGYHHKYYKLSGSRKTQMTFIADLKMAIKNAYDAQNITDAVIIDQDMGSSPYAIYKSNRQAIAAMKYRGKTTVYGVGADETSTSSPGMGNMEDLGGDDDEGNLTKKFKPTSTTPDSTRYANTSSQSNTSPVVNTVQPNNDHLFQMNTPEQARPIITDQTLHDILDNYQMEGLNSMANENQHIMTYELAQKYINGDPDVVKIIDTSSYPEYEKAVAILMVKPNLSNFLTAYNKCPSGLYICKTIFADIMLEASKVGIEGDILDHMVARFFDFYHDNPDDGELRWIDWLEENQICQYDLLINKITWPTVNKTTDIFEDVGSSGGINSVPSASS